MRITKRFYGKTLEGNDASIFTLSNSKGATAEISDFGGIVVSLCVLDKRGKLDDVVLGHENFKDYLRKGPFFGALIGRHANRIEDSKFEIDGVEYNLYKNEGNNHLHGGQKGFDKVLWQAEILKKDEMESLKLTYLSKDGEEGYPGNLEVNVTYTLTEDNALEIKYFAVSDKETVINLTNHSYFNLSGHASGDILKHKVMINSDKFTVADKFSLPTGEIRTVKGTPMDFTELTTISDGIDSDYEQITFANGYDHNWILNVSGKSPEKAAEVYDEKSGRIMEVFTTMPGVQLYTGNFLDGTDIGKGGVVYKKNNGLCLETQFFPNSLRHKHFPSPLFKAGQEYNHTTIYKFSVI
ncbi:MAG TPA: aldose epimerase family protein [Ruminiclostridium sp.]